MYFLEDTHLRGIERMMRSVPNFAQRGRGVMTLDRHEYTAKDCDCRYCLYYTGRGKKAACGLEHCVCLEERIRVGAAAHREIMTEAMYAIRYPPFRSRLNEYIKESEEPLWTTETKSTKLLLWKQSESGIKKTTRSCPPFTC